jgi:hypothetical protein
MKGFLIHKKVFGFDLCGKNVDAFYQKQTQAV